MKILWVTNTIFPDLAKSLNQQVPVVGGWMYSLAKDLSRNKNVKLTVATARSAGVDFNNKIDSINYYLLKGSKSITKYDGSLEKKWASIINKINPDLVHIHGTEYTHGLALIKACPELRYVISIQGLTSLCSRYYYAGISLSNIYKHITLRDIIKQDSIINGKKKFYKRGELFEKQYIKLTSNIIGRTQWDNNHVKTINPDCNYHFCNESLRDVFYQSRKWDINKMKKQSIFLSQAGMPLKGLHKVLEAVFLLKDEFPNITLRVAGGNIVDNRTLKSRLKITGYGKFVKQLLKKYNLLNKVTFTGSLNESEMINEYLNSNIFICPSSIENSPNSLGEAQLLGVPSIAAYVGGVPDMINHMETGLLYRFEEIEMLAQAIKSIFSSPKLSTKLSQQGAVEATKRHDRKQNLNQLLSIYNTINGN